MSETGLILRTTQQIVNYFGLVAPGHGHFADAQGRLDITGAVFRAVTGTTPNAFLDDPDTARLLIETNTPVMTAIRWISAVLPGQPPHDDDTGIDDHIEHLAAWLDDTDPFLRRRPNTSDVIGVLGRAAQAADTITDIPAQRAAA
ncbi:hypothetical protein [Streptomyces roseoviridis]|uniref:Uncharacterized protein n=1 Tax=Streptomyces roseoviridis TaxID=67361 RepID=A0ABV5QYY1_9ACTN